MRTVFVLFAALIISACQAQVPLNTPSGRPEEIIELSPQATKSFLIEDFLNKGFTLKNSNEYQLVFEKPLANAFASMLLASRYDPNPQHRLVATLTPYQGDYTKVYLESWGVTNPGSAFERLTRLSADDGPLQNYLQAMKNITRPQVKPGEAVLHIGTGERIENGQPIGSSCIIRVLGSAGAAKRHGLRLGDTILSIDGIPCGEEGLLGVKAKGNWQPGVPLTFEILREGKVESIKVVPDVMK